MTERYTDLQTRNKVIKGRNFPDFGEISQRYVETFRQPPELKDAVSNVASKGVWGKLNNLNLLEGDKPVVFTGQQPTLDYGVYRRIGKRSGSHENTITIHTHADHDRAGKDGFAEVEFPILLKDEVSYKTYRLPSSNNHTLMSEVPTPAHDTVEAFFGDIITDAQGSVATADTSLIEDCRNFILKNLDDIRSLAEFNAAVQTYLVRKMSPQIETVDLMLSDFLEEDFVREKLAEAVLEMPDWIDDYNKAANHVRQIDFPGNHSLPKPLETLEENGVTLNKLPLWIADKSQQRTRAWMRKMDNKVDIGVWNGESEKFETAVSFRIGDKADSIISQERFSDISPAAVTLVDLLRNRLHLPVIHGKTGHFYETINEIASEEREGERVPNGMVLFPNGSGPMAPVASVSYRPRRPGKEKKLLNNRTREIQEELAELEGRSTNLNREKGVAYQKTKKALDEALSSFGLEKVDKLSKIPQDHEMHGVEEELKEAHRILTEKEADINVPNMVKPYSLANLLYQLKTTMGDEGSRDFLARNSFERLQHLHQSLQEYFAERENQEKKIRSHNEMESRISDIEEESVTLQEKLVEDTPLLVAAVYKPRAVAAIARLQESKIRNNEEYTD